jgi:recombination protein U
MAKNPGKKFEEDFVKSIPDRCDVTRLKDAGGWSKSADLRFTIKNPCDFIVFSGKPDRIANQMYKLELKSLKGKSLPYSNIKGKTDKLTVKEASLKFVNALEKSQNKGVGAMFIVNFRDVNKTFAVTADIVRRHIEDAKRSSIPIAWFEEHGVLIKQELVRVRYKYDLEWL